VPLDDLVGAPPEGDRRLQLTPGRFKGRTVIPLTQQPDGTQAWKIIVPTAKGHLELRAHEGGHEWIYVLSGQMRIVLSGEDWILCAGEVASFATTVPHWFGSTGERPAEIISIFRRPGERMTFRPERRISALRRGPRSSSCSPPSCGRRAPMTDIHTPTLLFTDHFVAFVAADSALG
jgi:quercetin dioxygenase-like cupin family protein